MKNKKSERVLKRIMSFSLVLTMVFSLIVSADIFYPTKDNLASAATFQASGSGIGAPVFNVSNFQSLNTNASTKYYYGKEGNAFYGVGANSNIWELVDTDAKMNGTELKSTWGSGTNGQTILDYANNLASSHFSAADKAAMGTKSVDTKDYSSSGTGSISNAYMWPLSYTQLNANKTLGGALYTGAGAVVWSRSFGDFNSNCYAWCVYNSSGDLSNYYVTYTQRVAPAFNLDLSKVLIARSASSATSQTSLSSTSVASGDLKFLVNAGTNKSSFNVSAINGKNLTNVFAGTTYTFDYTGASTGQLNGGTNYVSCILYDTNGRIAYYGNLGIVSSSSGTASITIPSGLTGTYTMALFQEEKCAAQKTDYASSPVYARFTVQTRNYETNATISSTQGSSVSVGDVIGNDKFSANVTYLDGKTSTSNVYLIPSADFNNLSNKRSVNTTSVTVPSGTSTFKVTAVFVPTYTDVKEYWSKEFVYDVNYENSTSFSTSHGSSFSLNDTITSSEFSGQITWLNGTKSDVSADEIYIVPTNVWNTGMSKQQVAALDKYSGGKSIKIDSSELAGAQSYSITAVYFPKVSGAEAFHAQNFEFASSTLYPTNFKASYSGDKVEFGDLLTDADFSGKYVLSDGDHTEVEASVKYILPTETWNNLSAEVKGNETQLKKIKGINSTVVPSESDLSGQNEYSITVVYYDYSEQHSYGGGVDAGECNYYAVEVKVPLVSVISKDYKSYTALGITWYYKLDEDNNAIELHTVNEDINQIIDKNGVLNIPQKVDGFAVKSIGTGKKSTPFIPAGINSFTSIKFPDTLTDINDYGFYANTAFMRLVIPSTVSTVGNFAFYDCDNISDVKVTSAKIGAASFGNCDSLIELSVDGNSSIGKVAFAECLNLTKVTVAGNTSIGKSAFANDVKINAVNFKNMTSSKMEAYAFKDCTSIKEVYVPNTNKVEAYAFDGCSGITNLELDIDTVENNSFEGCYNIKYLVFGKNVSTVQYNWGGYSADRYDSNSGYTDVINTTIYVKNKDTRFETYRDGEEFYSSFMGHYVPGGSYKYSRKVSVNMPKEASTGHSTDGTLVKAVANYYQTAQDDVVENGNTYKQYYTAKGVLDITFDADENEKTINLPSTRDGITAYYNGKVYDNAKVDKSKVIVKPIYSDAAQAKETIADFNFYAASEADSAIRDWIKTSDYSYRNVISGKLEDKEYSYSQYLGFVESNKITGDDLETERLAMIQSIFNDKSLFLAATADIVDNPRIYEVDNNQNYVIQHMNVIFYPNSDLEMDADYTDDEPIYYITTIDVKVVKYTDEMYFFDQGFTYETVAKEVKDLQDSIAALQENVEKLEKDNNDLAVTKNEYSEQLAQCKQELNQYTTMYNEMVKELNEYIGSTDVAEDGYFGTKTETKEDGSVDTTNVVWVNGSECVYQKTEDYIEVDGISRNIYSGTGDIDEDGIPDNFKFYVANDGVHVIEKDGEPFEKVYSDPIRALERKLTAQLTSVREQLSGISVRIKALKEALGIDDPDFDDLSSEEQLEIILEKVNDLLSEKANLEKQFTENTKTIADYVDAMDQIYEKLISGNLDETDVSTLQKKLEKILSDIEGIQDENVRLSGRVGELEEEIQTLQEKLDGKDVEIKEKDATIEDLEKNIKELQTNVTNLNKTISEQAGTIQSLESNVSSLTEDNDKLKEEVESLSDDVSSLESSNAEQQERIEGLSELLTEKEEKISEGTATIEDLQNTIAQANLTVKDLKTENEAQAETITSLQNRVSTLSTLSESQESKIKKLSSDINDLKDQNESLDNTITALKKTISEQSTNITELNGTIEKLQTEISGYKNTISDQEKTIASLTESAEGYVLTVNDASDLFGTSKNASAKEVKESINAFVVAKTESENTIKEIQKKLGTNATGNELVALVGKAGKEDSTSASNHTPVPQNTSETTSDNTAYQNLLRDYSILKIENSSLTRDNETLRNENSSLKSDNRDLEKDITALKISSATQTNASGTNVDNTSLASRNTTLERENAVLSSEVASLKDTVKENKESIQSLTAQNTSLTKEMETLKADEKENKEAIQSLKEQNTSLTEKNDSLTEQNTSLAEKYNTLNKKNSTLTKASTALNKRVTALNSKVEKQQNTIAELKEKNEELKKANNSSNTRNSSSSTTSNNSANRYPDSSSSVSASNYSSEPSRSSASSYNVPVTTSSPKNTAAPAGNEKNTGKEKTTPTPMPKVSEKPGISSTLVASDNSDSGNGLGTVITEELPEKSDASEVEGVKFTPLDTESSYIGVVTSNGSEDLDTTSDEKANANTVFSHYACNLEALGNLGAEEIMDAMDNAGEIVGIKALASIDVVPSSIQDKAIEAGEKLTLNLSSNDFTNGNMYLVVHESEKRDGKFDVSLVKAQDGAIDVELEDLSPVAVAEVTVTKAGTFSGNDEVPEGEINGIQSSNSGLKIIYIIVAIAALGGAGALLWAMKSGKLKRRYS